MDTQLILYCAAIGWGTLSLALNMLNIRFHFLRFIKNHVISGAVSMIPSFALAIAVAVLREGEFGRDVFIILSAFVIPLNYLCVIFSYNFYVLTKKQLAELDKRAKKDEEENNQ
ncbi:MAG TPA: hypothetical protein PKY53_00485 [Clostridia bacterium]|jgi:hypothetical protein|nr:hypothetical protein [Clostridia bacterium]